MFLSLNEKFAEARLRVLGDKISGSGIGTYSEKSLHKILKCTLEPDITKHEIPHLDFIADIKNGSGIIEIQTRALKNLRSKLKAFLPYGSVTVVYPMYKSCYRRKVLKGGEISAPRLSPRHQRVCDAAYELYNIRDFLGCENLKVVLLFLAVEEYVREGIEIKVAGRKRTKERIERIPYRIEDIVELSSPEDYLRLLPDGLLESFGIADINKGWGKKFKHGYSIISIFKALSLIDGGEKVGKAIKYRIKNR